MSKAIERPRNLAVSSITLDELSDEELIVRYRDTGERPAFNTLVGATSGSCTAILRRYLGDASMAEDAFQATFLQVHLKCDQYEEGRKFRPWLYTIATNQAIDAHTAISGIATSAWILRPRAPKPTSSGH